MREITTGKIAFKERFLVPDSQHFKVVTVDETTHFMGDGKYTFLIYTSGKEYLIDTNLSQLEEQLNPKLFFRLNRAVELHYGGHLCFGDGQSLPVYSKRRASCDSVVTLNLTIEFIDDSVVLSALTIYALPRYDSYQWYECTSNGYMMMSNETNDSIYVTANGDDAVVINNNNCSDTSDCVTVNNIGLREQTKATFRIYPNPTQGKVKIERDNSSSPTGTYQLHIVDSRGKVTQRSNVDFKDGFIIFNLEDYPAGVYQISLMNEHEVFLHKISKVH